MQPSPKKRRTNDISSNSEPSTLPRSSRALTRDISPPPKWGRNGEHFIDEDKETANKAPNMSNEKGKQSTIVSTANCSIVASPKSSSRWIPSPIHLTRVEGLSLANNVDCLSLGDLIGNPLIKECWAFNYLFDVEFLL